MLSKPVLALLAITLGLTIYVASDEEKPAVPPAAGKASGRTDLTRVATSEGRADPAKPAAAGKSVAPEAGDEEAGTAAMPIDLFPLQTWVVPPPPPPPPPPAVAPPLPFTVDVIWQDAGGRYVVLGLRDQQVVICERCQILGSAKPGDSVFDQYRLESIAPDKLVFTYLPLRERQELRL